MTRKIRKNSTEIFLVGPFVKTDGITGFTSVALASASAAKAYLHDTAAGVDLSGFTWATATAAGYFHLTLTSAITSVVGPAAIVIQNSTDYLPVKVEYQVMGSAPFDSLYSSAPNILTSLDIGLLYEGTVTSTDAALRFEMSGDGIAVDNNWVGQTATIEDISTGDSHVTWVASVSATNNLIVVAATAGFTPVAGDKVRVDSRQHPTYALNNYDPPTRTELTADKDAITDRLQDYVQLMVRNDAAIVSDNSAALNLINQDEGSGAGSFDPTKGINTNTIYFNGVQIIGSGSADNLFRTSGT